MKIIILLLFITVCYSENMELKNLTKEEKKIIIHKGTEMPFSGKYVNYKKDGFFHCKRCGEKLFHSKDKFNSGTGWPSFDDQVGGNVKEIVDADGVRREIVCQNCGGHLGHVFRGEGFTSKSTRYCVNSLSLIHENDKEIQNTQKAYFGAGCFWGVEYYFQKKKGVLSTEVGYMGGHVNNPSYEDVCRGNSGHIEIIEVVYNPKIVDYHELVKLFFNIHDPTQKNRQGPDFGRQYQSVIFYGNDQEKNISENLIQELKDKKELNIQTELLEKSIFYKAEEYHQDYYDKKGSTPYCHSFKDKFG